MAKKDLQQLQLIRERMIASGIPEKEVDDLITPLKDELQRRVCGLVWEHMTTSIPDMEGKIPALIPVTGKNIVNDLNGDNHILIEGENLLALMAMQYTHIDENGKGMIDVIYIDPPYNTGSVSFAYNDKFEKSEWLSMMDIRLKLAKNLLKDDGVIFISIDERYQAELKLLLNDVFGPDNALSTVAVVNNLKGRSDDKFFATAYEYLFVYAKNKMNAVIYGLPMDEKTNAEYKYEDAVSRYKLVSLKKTGKNCYKEDRPNMYYPIYYDESSKQLSLNHHDGGIEILPSINGREGCWRWGKDKFQKYAASELVCKKQKDEYAIYVKMRDIVDGSERTTKPKTIWLDPKYDSGAGTRMIKDIFGDKTFENPKPLEYIKDILKISTKKDSVVFDFFAGSGTTGHAVLDLNKEDGGHRQFILCTNNELGKDALKTAKKNGYIAGSEKYEDLGVCHAVTYPRMQNVFPNYPGNNLYYYRIDQSITESAIDDVTITSMASQAVFYIAMKENVFNAKRRENYYLLYNAETEIAVITDPDMDMFDVDDDIVPDAFTKSHRKIYCSVYEPCNRNGIEYVPYPKEVLDVLKAAKKYIRREVA